MSEHDRELDELKQKLDTAEEALKKADKMATLGSLVAGVAHEINTPVGSIHSNSDLMVRALEKLRAILSDAPGLEGQKELTRILDALENIGRVNQAACERIVTMVRSLRTFARLEEPECRTVDLHEEIDNVLTLVHHELKNRVEVVRDYGDLPPVECFPHHLSQVFMNVLVNASQAIEGKGRVRITTRRDGDDVRIQFQDSGSGIRPENLEKIFEAGFTTKDVDEGTGLGLAICNKIVGEHHGRIDVESKVGEGTTFTVILPITPSKTSEER